MKYDDLLIRICEICIVAIALVLLLVAIDDILQ
jgi:hypothetical protein